MDNSVWTLETALTTVRAIQPMLKVLGYHVALAGGTLNRGFSEKDLDLVFLPLTNDKAPDVAPLMTFLAATFGQPSLDEGSHSPNPYTPYREQWVFPYAGKRIDVFIA